MSETVRLIELVKKKRFLYDMLDTDYRNRNKRLQAWQDIARKMGAGQANMWSSKWKGLKDNYVKFKKNDEPGVAHLYKKYKNWPWVNHMKFLDEVRYAGNRRSYRDFFDQNNKADGQDSDDQKPTNVQLIVPDTNETDLHFSIQEITNDPIAGGSEDAKENNTVKKRKNHNSLIDSENIEEVYVKMKKVEDTPLDGVDHFFLSYAKSFKQLPNKMQIMLKLEIATLFSRYELQAEGVSKEAVDSFHQMIPQPMKYEFITTTIN